MPEPQDDGELRDMRRRFAVAAVLSAPLLVVGMADMLPGHALAAALAAPWAPWAQLALATPVVWWAGWPLLARGWAEAFAERSRRRGSGMRTQPGPGLGLVH